MRLWASLGCIYLIWGSTPLSIKLMVETVPALLGSAIRFFCAGMLLWGWLAIRGNKTPWRLHDGELATALILGTLLIAGGPGLTAVAERTVPSGLAALIVAVLPLWIILLRLLTGERIAKRTLVGVVVGFAGVGLILVDRGGRGSTSVVGVVLLLGVAVSFGTGSFLAGRLGGTTEPLALLAVEMFVGSLLCMAGAFALGELGQLRPATISFGSWFGMLYLIGPGTLLGYVNYLWLLRHAPISRVATFAYVSPVVAVLLGWSILSEHIGIPNLIGAAIILSSVALVITRET